jgi:hypothetical protein
MDIRLVGTTRPISWLLASLSLCLCIASTHATTDGRFPVSEALDLYQTGHYAQFFAAIDAGRAIDREEFKNFDTEAKKWIHASEGAAVARRRLIASSVAIEIAHALRHESPQWPAQYLIWACRSMGGISEAPTSAVERLWYLAALAGMEELDDPWTLVDGCSTGNPTLDRESRAMPDGGELAVALKRFPDEPRFRLAQVGCAESRIEGFYLDVPSRRQFASMHAHDPIAPSGDGGSSPAARIAWRLQQVPNIESAYRALETIPSVRGEALLHLGFAEAIDGNLTAALLHLRAVPALTDEAYLRYLSQYLIGRTLQNVGDHAGAVEAFESALAIVPNARSSATQLASELLVAERSADRDRAYGLLRGAYSNSAPDDPWRWYFHGDARLWPTYMAYLRSALQ